MLQILLWILVGLCLALGFLGCFINKFPGPLMVLISVLIARYGLDIPIEYLTIGVIALMWIASMLTNKLLLPKLAKKIHDFSSAGSWGCTIGCLVGMPLLTMDVSASAVVGLAFVTFVILPYAFSFIFEFH